MSRTATVSLEPLLRMSPPTLEVVLEAAADCPDCAAIKAALVDGNALGPARRGGKPFTVEQQKAHVLTTKGTVISREARAMLRERAGTCRRPDVVGCFYCARILDVIDVHGKLNDWPKEKDEQVRIPVDAQEAHVMLEAGGAVEWVEVK